MEKSSKTATIVEPVGSQKDKDETLKSSEAREKNEASHSGGLKRKHDRERSPSAPEIKRRTNTSDSAVAKHYNRLPESGLGYRSQSNIFFMRNFNNWVKSVLLKSYQNRIRDEGQRMGIVALDLGCGKGGDLLKWKKGNVKKLVCTDIAGTSVEQCKDRYLLNKKRARGRIFDAEFIVADSAKDLLSEMYKDKEMLFDLVSCQFVIHYSFENEEMATRMMENACERLRPGGYFIGTTVDSNALRERLDQSSDFKFGNDVYSITFGSKDKFVDFGHKYDFHLDGVVDCPEYVAKREVLERLAKKFGMKLVLWQTFSEFFSEYSEDRENKDLLMRMKALEQYPNRTLNGQDKEDYSHAKIVCDDIHNRNPNSRPLVATLSLTEWKASSLYAVYAFKKVASDDKELEIPPSSTSEIPLLVLNW